MNQSRTFFLCLSFLVTISFLISFDHTLNIEFQIIQKEIDNVHVTLLKNERQSFYELENLSKKRNSYSKIIDNYITTKEKAKFVIQYPEIIHKSILGINLPELNKDQNVYWNKALNAQDSILSRSYLQMALCHHLQELIDSLSENKHYEYNSKLVTIDEPLTYHVGNRYPISFGVINTISDNQNHILEVIQNGNKVLESDFPLIYKNPPPKQEFIIRLNNGRLYHTSNRFTIKPKKNLNP